MTDEQRVIDHQVPSLAELEAATHYRNIYGVVRRIVSRDRTCPGCFGTTRLWTEAGVWSTFTRLHVDAGHLR